MFERFIAIAADFSIIIPFIYLLFKGKIPLTISDKLIYVYIVLTLIRNIASFVTMMLGIYNIYVYNWYNLLSFGIIAVLYFQILNNLYFKMLVVFASIILLAIAFIDYGTLFNINTTEFNRFSFNASGCFTILFILFFLYELIRKLQVKNLTEYPLFWFSSGALLYYSGTIFPYIFVQYTFNNMENRNLYWMIDAALSIVFSIFLCFSIWYMKPSKTV